jgi:hypothetical protein
VGNKSQRWKYADRWPERWHTGALISAYLPFGPGISLLATHVSAKTTSAPTSVDWVAVATFAVALVAVLALFTQGWRDKRALGISNLWKLIEAWDAPESRLRRAVLAEDLIANPDHRQEISGKAIDVLNTFELVGYLMRARVVREGDAWVNFYVWAVSWWYVFEPALLAEREAHNVVYQDYYRLVKVLKRREALEETHIRRWLHLPIFLHTLERYDADGFLRAEARLRYRLPPGYVPEPIAGPLGGFLTRLGQALIWASRVLAAVRDTLNQ